MEENIEDPIRIPALTAMLGISQRKLERLFNKYFNCSAVAFYRIVRLQQAPMEAETGRVTIAENPTPVSE